MKNKIASIPSFFGANARAWRKQLATSAKRVDDTIRTLKYPLDIKDASAYWPAATHLYQTIASDEPGSLIRFLYTLNLSGFRVFGKQAETEAFRNAQVLDDQSWRDQVLTGSDLSVAAKSFVPSNIYQRLLFAPRAVGGKDSGFKAATIAIEYAKFFCAGKHSENIPPAEAKLFLAIGEALERTFTNWKDVVMRTSDAATVIDKVLKDLGYAVPERSLYVRIASIRPCEPAGTVAFDSSSVSVTAPAGAEPHLIVATALRQGKAAGLASKPELTKHVQCYWTGDANHGGLAWLFGKGLSYFQSTSVSDAMSDFGIDDSRKADVEIVLAAAKAIPLAETSLLGGKNYSGYRSSIGGTLGSWIANYISRLYELDEVLSGDVEPFLLPDALLADEKLLADTGITASEIVSLVDRAIVDRLSVKDALLRLNGDRPDASYADIECLEQYNSLLDTLAGLLASLTERVSKALSYAKEQDDTTAAAHLENYLFVTPKWIRRLDALNRLNLSVVDPEKELQQAAEQFDQLHEAMHTHFARLQDWAQTTGQTLSPLVRLEAQEAGYARNGKKTSCSPQEQAARAGFDMIGRAARECSESTLRRFVEVFRSNKIFADETDGNRFFHNRQGRLYKSSFDKSPRYPFAITQSAMRDAEQIMASISAEIALFRKEVMTQTPLSLTGVIDLYKLERALFAWRMIGMPSAIPSELALPEGVDKAFNLPLALRMRLSETTVSSMVLRQVFNHYYVRLKSLAAMLLRDKFYLRCKFQRSGDNALLYSAHGDHWSVPERLYKTDKPIGHALRYLQSAGKSASDGSLHPSEALETLLANREDVGEGCMRVFLRQSPHDWFFPWPACSSIPCVRIDKTGINKRVVSESAARLIGAPGYKGVLDTMLSTPDAVEIGDVAILFDQSFAQTVSRDNSGKLVLQITRTDATVTLALPIKEVKEDLVDVAFPRYVAIDLGERGIGYAVFDASTDVLLDQGRVKVRSMQELVRNDKIGKRITLSIDKFRSKFDRAEERRRENIVGDYCNAINRLMWFYQAFPVLEYAAGGASSAVDKVYAGIAERYLFTGTPTVDAARSAYWCGASFWKHPTRMQYKFDKATGKKGKTPESLSLFPGVGVSAYGTSQRCSCCGRNPVETLREMMKVQKKFQIEEGGIVKLSNGEIVIRFSAPESERAAFRRRNERTPLSKIADAMPITGDDLMRAIKRNLRQAPQNKQVKDTTISHYHCLYADCGKVIHAEENASINIGCKFAENSPRS